MWSRVTMDCGCGEERGSGLDEGSYRPSGDGPSSMPIDPGDKMMEDLAQGKSNCGLTS